MTDFNIINNIFRISKYLVIIQLFGPILTYNLHILSREYIVCDSVLVWICAHICGRLNSRTVIPFGLYHVSMSKLSEFLRSSRFRALGQNAQIRHQEFWLWILEFNRQRSSSSITAGGVTFTVHQGSHAAQQTNLERVKL